MRFGKVTWLMVTLFSLLSSENAHAQPGDRYGEFRLKRFQVIQDSIKQNPENCFFKWSRLEILFRPSINLHTQSYKDLTAFLIKTRHHGQDSITVLRPQMCKMCKQNRVRILNPLKQLNDFVISNQKELLQDLTTIINEGCPNVTNATGIHGGDPNKASFLYKRGQYYYLTGDTEKALGDYFEALKNHPIASLKREIYVSIAAYYYNLDDTVNVVENNSMALKYIALSDMNMSHSGHRKGEPVGSLYESEKVLLLKSLNDSTQLVNFLQQRSASYLSYYYDLMAKRPGENGSKHYETKALNRAREYEHILYEYLKEKHPEAGSDEFIRHKKEIIRKI